VGSQLRGVGLALAVIAATLLKWGCGPASGPHPRRSFRTEQRAGFLHVRDDLGRTITIPRPPRRIVCLAPNVTEIIFALGLGERVVGVSEFSDFPPEAREKPQVGRYDRPSLERIVALRPDLVILGHGNPRELALALERARITAFGLNPKTIEESFRALERIGEICGVQERAQQLSETLRTRVEKVRKRVAAGNLRRPRVFIMIDEEPLWTAGRNTLQDEILRLAGGENIASRPSYYPLSKEALFAAQPDLILIPGKPSEARSIRQRIRARKDLSSLSAVRRGHIVVVDGDIYSRPGPRIAEAVEELYGLMRNYSAAGDSTTSSRRRHSGFGASATAGKSR